MEEPGRGEGTMPPFARGKLEDQSINVTAIQMERSGKTPLELHPGQGKRMRQRPFSWLFWCSKRQS
ncbi:MAG TPA: hypothetical protein PLN19_00345 [Methanothrix sp.]|nr:hypothetical protein [Methanothrix sp.]